MIRFSISNIAWPGRYTQNILNHLNHYNFTAIEIAPSKIASWPDLTYSRIKEEARLLSDNNIKCSSLQSIFYDKLDCQLLESDASFNKMLSHFDRVADIATLFNTRNVIFGSPKNRSWNHLYDRFNANLAINRLQSIIDLISDRVILAIEPIPSYYGCNFLCGFKETYDFVKIFNNQKIKIHLDTACILLNGDDICSAIDYCSLDFNSFHISEINLLPISNKSDCHVRASRKIRSSNFDGWCTIEMRESENFENEIIKSLSYINNIYSIQC